jgi:predicted esterase
MVPVQESERLADLLRSFGVDVTLNWQPTGHGIEPEEIDAAKKWLEEKRLVDRAVLADGR